MPEIAFEPWHVGALEGRVDARNAQTWPEFAIVAKESGEAWSFTYGERIIACYGFLPVWPGRSTMWGMGASDLASRGVLALARTVKQRLSVRTEYRIEAHAREDWKQAGRLLECLGFEFEAYLPCYWGRGNGASQYVIVKD